MRRNEFEFAEITEDVIIYVDKYIKLLMSNVKYSFLEKYNAEQKLICNYIHIKENDIRFSYQDAGVEKILSDIYVVESTEVIIKNSRISSLQISGKLNDYLANIDQQAKEMFERLVMQMAAAEGVTEQLKATDQMAWVGRMNSIRNRAIEIVNSEIIFI